MEGARQWLQARATTRMPGSRVPCARLLHPVAEAAVGGPVAAGQLAFDPGGSAVGVGRAIASIRRLGLETEDLVDLGLGHVALALRGSEHEVTDEPDLALELLVVQ